MPLDFPLVVSAAGTQIAKLLGLSHKADTSRWCRGDVAKNLATRRAPYMAERVYARYRAAGVARPAPFGVSKTEIWSPSSRHWSGTY